MKVTIVTLRRVQEVNRQVLMNPTYKDVLALVGSLCESEAAAQNISLIEGALVCQQYNALSKLKNVKLLISLDSADGDSVQMSCHPVLAYRQLYLFLKYGIDGVKENQALDVETWEEVFLYSFDGEVDLMDRWTPFDEKLFTKLN